MKRTQPTAPQPLAYTFRQFYECVYPCSRAHANTLVKAGELETFVDHGRRMVAVAKARAFVKRKAAAGGAVDPAVSRQKSEAGRKGKAVQNAAREAA